MDKLKKYIRCGFKILTSWKFIVFFLGITFITYYIQINRYVISYPQGTNMVVHDRVMNETCIAHRQYSKDYFSTLDMGLYFGCDERFDSLIEGHKYYGK